MAVSPLRVVFLDRDALPDYAELPALSFPYVLVKHDRTAPEQVAERISQADIIITNKIVLRAADLAAAPQLKMIALTATGSDNIDLNACNQRGIIVSNVRGYATNSVPEHTFALILALRRSLLAYHQSVMAGRWQASGQFSYFDYPIQDLAGSTLGIIGRGSLGEAVAETARALRMKVQFAARKDSSNISTDYTSFTHVLRSSDVITLHCPLNDQTRNMIGPAEFALMERKPLLINTARGGLVDEVALVQALQSGQISGAGFDAVSQEPPAPDHPFMALLGASNFILTPHVAWASPQAVLTLVNEVVSNIEAFYRDQPRNVVAGFRAP
ncbi:D-2-hydroxyacid dehydrogenase [Alcaligenaceae bacterium CGII-47]|nr:D-2-hydroxyacid dehydrogenase [Alcaligenaceae bacterium CGII-47]